MSAQLGASSIEALYKPLRRFAAVVAPLDVEPDDLLQEAVVRAVHRQPLEDYEDLGAYLRVTMVNLVRSHARRRPRTERVRRLLAAPPSVVAEHPDLSILDGLDPADRALLFLVDVEGFTFDEAAPAVGLRASAARQRASRARKRLRALLEGEDHDA